ncbi:MAG TPA: stage II sporulation protein M [Methanomicrobia archaeon]|nr:stage II sporulation protein M [Methanomicrobia archaeon]
MAEDVVSLRGYLFSLRYYLLFVCILFAAAVGMGYLEFFSELFSESLAWLQQLSEGIEDLTERYPSWVLFLLFFVVIFLNNAFTCVLNILTGLLLGIFPIFSTLLNGGLLGWLAHEEGLIVFLAIVPHGMFELPAYFISLAIGLRLAREALRPKGSRQLKVELGEGLRVYLRLILPLLFVAALVESVLIVIGILFMP